MRRMIGKRALIPLCLVGLLLALLGCKPYREMQQGFAESMYPEYYQQYKGKKR
jgi:hypothetical protein